MKRFLLLAAIAIGLFSCTTKEYELEKMGEAVKSHLKYRDIEKSTITKIEYLKALSYEEVPEDKRSNPDDVYLCKVYVKGTWAYENSFRVFNVDDTLNCIFNNKKVFVRIDNEQ